MPTVDALQTLLVNELRDLLDAEHRLTKAIPKLMKASTDEGLEMALEQHLGETEQHVTRLEKALRALDSPVKAKPCKGIKGIIEEGDEHLHEDFSTDALKDAAVIAAAQKAEHYEMAAYGTVLAQAKELGLDQIVKLLKPTLEEEKAADEKLTEIGEGRVNAEAARAVEGEDGERELAGAGVGRSAQRARNGRR